MTLRRHTADSVRRDGRGQRGACADAARAGARRFTARGVHAAANVPWTRPSGDGEHHPAEPRAFTAPANVLRRQLQAADEIGHNLGCWLRPAGERNTLSCPHRKRLDLAGSSDQRRRRGVTNNGFA